MLEVLKHGVILHKTDLGFENEAVANPGAIRDGDFVHLLYRAVSKGNFSSIGYCKLSHVHDIDLRHETPLIYPQFDYECHGVEDPRITKIDDLYYITYTAYDGVNAMGALVTSKDLVTFEKHGIIVPQVTYEEFKHLASANKEINIKYQRFNDRDSFMAKPDKKVLLWDKNLIFFPRRINGKLAFMHRIRPDIQIAFVDQISDLTKDYWDDYLIHFSQHIAMKPRHKHEVSYIGGGCTPIETPDGWLIIYHGVHDTPKGYVYAACAALLDLENPLKELARLPYPLFRPEIEWELKGEVNNVCFPTGAVVFDDTLHIYYGAADERIACAGVNLPALLKELKLNIN